jgi:hypothetical protein
MLLDEPHGAFRTERVDAALDERGDAVLVALDEARLGPRSRDFICTRQARQTEPVGARWREPETPAPAAGGRRLVIASCGRRRGRGGGWRRC